MKALTVLASAAYYFMWLAGALVVVLPLLQLLGVPGVHLTTSVPVSLPTPEATIASEWGNGVFGLHNMRGVLEIPWAPAPAWFILVDWLRQALEVGLTLVFLHQLRRFFRDVRLGQAFTAGNALRLRRLAVLLLAAFLVQAVFGSFLSVAGRLAVQSGSIHLGMRLGGGLTPVAVALVLLMLAEVFGHGAELEDERALVI